MEKPFVSIIVPVYNGKRTIGACLESLLAQDYPKDRCEVIVVDNGSTDGTKKIIESFSGHQSLDTRHQKQVNAAGDVVTGGLVTLLDEQKRGSYAARNTGVKHAKGEILAFTDADCIADKDWLKEGVAGFTDDSVGCVAGRIENAAPSNYVEKYLADRNALSQERKEDAFALSYAKTANAFYRKEVFDRIGCFEERWVSGGDADLSWRMQIKAGYQLKFSDRAIISHKHRDSLSGLFKQCVTWGKGYKILQRKYPEHVKKRTLKQLIWILGRLCCVAIAVIPFLFSSKEDLRESEIKYYLDMISFAGFEIGKMAG